MWAPRRKALQKPQRQKAGVAKARCFGATPVPCRLLQGRAVQEVPRGNMSRDKRSLALSPQETSCFLLQLSGSKGAGVQLPACLIVL